VRSCSKTCDRLSPGATTAILGCAALAGLAVVLASPRAIAAGFMIRENSAVGVATTYAGDGSRADSAATVFNNPAGMTRLTQDEVDLGTAIVIPSIKFNGGATAFGAPVSGTDGGSAGHVGPVPSVSWAFGIADRLKGGIAVTAPFGLVVAYNSPWVGRYVGIKTSVLSVDINPSLAYQLTDSLSLGGGVSAQYLRIDSSSAIPQFAIFGPGTPDATFRAKADDWAFGFDLGALLEVPGGTRFGLTYRSQMNHRIKGDLTFTGVLPLLPLTDGPAAADVHLPATVGLSATTDVTPDISLSADVQFSQWSVFKRVVIETTNPAPFNEFPNEEHYRDSWLISVGGVYRLDPVWSLRAGLGLDQTPITDAFRAVSLPDQNRILMGVGFGYRMTDAMSLDGGFQHSFPTAKPSMNKSANNTDPFTGAVVLNGNYDVTVDVVALSLRYRY
jgi:long-chain fatty acid transport protein